jgi:hypothetical protein
MDIQIEGIIIEDWKTTEINSQGEFLIIKLEVDEGKYSE